MPGRGQEIPLDAYFEGHAQSKALYDAVVEALNDIGTYEQRVTKTQVAFRRRLAFAWVWIPFRHLGRELAPLVLTVDLDRRDGSPRWKQVVEPRPGRFTHHLELYSAEQLDGEVMNWLREAWSLAE